jgi:Fe-S-cluster containining protein
VSKRVSTEEVNHEWHCKRCGVCCKIGNVSVTPAELKRLKHIATPEERKRLKKQLKFDHCFYISGSCPFLRQAADGKYFCRVYEHRPFRCRDFPSEKLPPEVREKCSQLALELSGHSISLVKVNASTN